MTGTDPDGMEVDSQGGADPFTDSNQPPPFIPPDVTGSQGGLQAPMVPRKPEEYAAGARDPPEYNMSEMRGTSPVTFPQPGTTGRASGKSTGYSSTDRRPSPTPETSQVIKVAPQTKRPHVGGGNSDYLSTTANAPAKTPPPVTSNNPPGGWQPQQFPPPRSALNDMPGSFPTRKGSLDYPSQGGDDGETGKRGGRQAYQTRPPQPKTILFYERHKPHYGFTNFSPHKVNYKGKFWPTSEHLFQASKFIEHRPLLAEHIRTGNDQPRFAFDTARKFSPETRKDWQQVNIAKMDEILELKFTQHAELKQELLETGDAILIENAGANDAFWGNGPDGKGGNHLGLALMRLREKLREQQPTSRVTRSSNNYRG